MLNPRKQLPQRNVTFDSRKQTLLKWIIKVQWPRRAIFFCKSQLFSIIHSFFLETPTISYNLATFSYNLATFFYKLQLFSTISQLFSPDHNFFLQITANFYNLATFFYKYCILILQRYRNSVIITRITGNWNARPGTLSGNQNSRGGGPNRLPKVIAQNIDYKISFGYKYHLRP